MLLGLSTAQLLSWGILYYAFSVFIRPLEQETGWTRTRRGPVRDVRPGGRPGARRGRLFALHGYEGVFIGLAAVVALAAAIVLTPAR